MDSKVKIIRELSNSIIIEKVNEGLSPESIIEYFRSLEPKNNIEKRTIQRSICILGGFLLMKENKFNNSKLLGLLSYLQIK